MKTPEDCNSFNGCSAPLCPLSEELKYCIWYPDEQVCNSSKFARLHWVKIQKRLRKLGLKYDAGYFTREMLDGMRYCRHGVRGINPEGKIAKGIQTPQNTPIPVRKADSGYFLQKKGYPGGQPEFPNPKAKPRQLVLV
jgi:hypothetical protein